MIEVDCGDAVATMSLVIGRELGLDDLPADQAASRVAVEEWARSLPDTVTADATGQGLGGLGSGADMITHASMLFIVAEAFLSASVHMGMHDMREALRRWLGQRNKDVPQPRVDVAPLLAKADVLHVELCESLKAIGLPDDRARVIAHLACAAIADRGSPGLSLAGH